MSDFKRTTITLTVLSEESVLGIELGALLEMCDTGPCVLGATDAKEDQLSDTEMSAALIEAGSDPGFFRLDEVED